MSDTHVRMVTFVPPEQAETVARLAVRDQRSQSFVVRQAVAEYLAHHTTEELFHA